MWIFDTYFSTWRELNPPLRIQGSMAGKKIRKQFEPRLAHTAVIIDDYVVVFGGLNSQKNALISNDIYLLCLTNDTAKILPPPDKRYLNKKKQILKQPTVISTSGAAEPKQAEPQPTKSSNLPSQKDRAAISGQAINQLLQIYSAKIKGLSLERNPVSLELSTREITRSDA